MNRIVFTIVLPVAIASTAMIWIMSGMWHRTAPDEADFNAFGRLPVLADGRVKNLDSVARGSLSTIRGKQSLRTSDGKRIGAPEWLLNLLARPENADAIPIFKVDHPDLLAMLGEMGAPRHVFSFDDLKPHGARIQQQANMAWEIRREERSLYQQALLNLDHSMTLYWRLRHSLHFGNPAELGEILERHESVLQPLTRELRDGSRESLSETEKQLLYRAATSYSSFNDLAQFYPIAFPHPEKPRGEWVSLGEALGRSLDATGLPPHVVGYKNIIDSFARGDNREFNGNVHALLSWKNQYFPEATGRARTEAIYNNLNLFFKSSVLYVGAFIFLAGSWIGTRPAMSRTALLLLAVALVAHTLGIAFRMYIQERPPVTSLHSSVIFVGWGAVILGLIIEKAHRNTMGATVAALLGFISLTLAINLGQGGDSMEVMRAVLNSNFWLTTHVVVITLGYSATFVAAAIGAASILRNLAGKGLGERQRMAASSAVYGVICFALLFTFAGTVLGGIWADQSWGRFWGWDPKENGALLIVLWLAVILHLRWGGMIGYRGLMISAVFAGVINSFAWFGVNMLGVGLHSYGFMDGGPFWLGAFMLSQFAIMGAACLPRNKSPAKGD